jgi:alpha-beta hydrolase superfamily lysophospholipase
MRSIHKIQFTETEGKATAKGSLMTTSPKTSLGEEPQTHDSCVEGTSRTLETRSKARRESKYRLRRHWILCTLLILFLAFLGLNALAYSHSRGMLRFVPGGTKTRSPQMMTWSEKILTLVNGVTVPKPVNYQTPKILGLPFTTHNFSSSDGIRLEAWYTPSSPSMGLVLLIHGYSGCKATLLQEGKHFHDLGYDVLWLDCRASGGSQGEWTTIGYLEALDVQAAVSYARKTWSPAQLVVFGQSMGGAAALRAIACQGCPVDRLIIEAPFDSLLHTVRHRFEAMKVPDFGLSRLLLFWGGWQAGIPGFDHNPAAYASAVHCPALILWGDQDRYVLRDEVVRVYDALGGPKSFCAFQGVDHMSCLTAAPDAWKSAVNEFLKLNRKR